MVASQTKDKQGNPVRFIRKNGRIIPIRDKGGPQSAMSGLNSRNRKERELHRRTNERVTKNKSTGKKLVDGAIGGIIGAGAGFTASVLGTIGAEGVARSVGRAAQKRGATKVAQGASKVATALKGKAGLGIIAGSVGLGALSMGVLVGRHGGSKEDYLRARGQVQREMGKKKGKVKKTRTGV